MRTTTTPTTIIIITMTRTSDDDNDNFNPTTTIICNRCLHILYIRIVLYAPSPQSLPLRQNIRRSGDQKESIVNKKKGGKKTVR